MKRIKYHFLLIFLVTVFVFILIFGSVLCFNRIQKTSRKSTRQPFTIVLDCGHGGPDGGAVAADGTAEKDINLALGFALNEFLVQNGYYVVMTRKTDDFICDDHTASLREQNVSDLHNRLTIAETYPNSVFLSLHMNQFSESQYHGSQLFYSPNHADSRLLAECIRTRLIKTVQQGNERPIKEMDSSVYIIYHATHPALLLECGFMSNPQELAKFKTASYRSQFAFEVFLGIQDFLNGEKNG